MTTPDITTAATDTAATDTGTRTPQTLEGRLAVELRTEVQRLTTFYELAAPTDPDHPRPILRGDVMVPSLLGSALETGAALEGLVADPTPNLKTRARLAEQLRYRAGIMRMLVADAYAALDTITPPADITEAIVAACAEVARLEDHAEAFTAQTYDPADEAAEAAAFMAAEVRGEAVGARRILTILLGLPTGEAADGGQAQAYVADWRAAQVDIPADLPAIGMSNGTQTAKRDTPPGMPRLDGPALFYVTEQGSTPSGIVMLRLALATHKPGDDWSQAPLFVTDADHLNRMMLPGEAQQIAAHTAVVVPIRYRGLTPPGDRVPYAALEGLAALTFHSADKLAEFLEAHEWNDQAREWQGEHDAPPATA